MKNFKSDLSGKDFPEKEKVSAEFVRKPIIDLIKKDAPQFNDSCSLSMSELNFYREKYITDFLQQELGELDDMEKKVVQSLKDKSLVSDNPDDEDPNLTLGQRVADKVAAFGGSWTFILSFIFFLLAWIGINAFFLANKGFDPYPFILLNLILSCVAALQAPVIMMSQNRQGEKDREKAQNDYMVNLKSELEIRLLHEKIDHLILHQEQSLLEIQQVQIDMMNDILKKIDK
ncbi:hypothetical protein AM493_05225 [Flavobacterium akiainvivens]|uniref:Cyclic nucleotide-binding protein n=1 Tax=Flavobacterium akiainvivens TaxID=1202724 RepID=A0A0N0RQI0_9FLAO|nr:DUF1003 domain-containing protein [Flavobacterium akiainvivens]KOS05499.1 hypothetical protein AM493_05225 [Flavobacterium akiainvivens]SFQ33152.1 Uncharacterized membrane protein [Flavobacterium akiainvivens]